MANKKIARVLASCIALILLLVNLTSCLTFELSGIGGSVLPTADGCYIDGKKTELKSPERESLSYKNMGGEEKMIYSAAYTALSEGHNVFVLKNVDYQKTLEIYGDALMAFLYDYPEFFWLSGFVKADAEYQTGSKNGNVTLTLGIYDYWSNGNLDEARRTFNTALVSFLNGARMIEGDYERVKYVHDRIIDNTEYDEESYRLGDSADAMIKAYSNTAYGALVEGKALCGGYAKLFGLVMHSLGYECEYITGVADGGPHAWNFLKLDGEYYHIDLTWDDPDKEDGIRFYNYFCVNDDMISKTHTADAEYKYWESSAVKYNYHVYESLYLEKYNYEAVKNIVSSRSSEKVISIKFKNKRAKEDAFDSLIDDYKFFDILDAIGKDTYSYIDNDEMCILTFIID